MEKYKSIFKEEDENAKSVEAIKDLVDLKKVDTADEKGKFLELIKGLVFANNAQADKFLTKLNTFTSGLKAEDYSK